MKNITKVLAVFGLLLAVFAFSGSALAREGVSDSYQFLNNLSMGSSGEDVALLQTKLIELGFNARFLVAFMNPSYFLYSQYSLVLFASVIK